MLPSIGQYRRSIHMNSMTSVKLVAAATTNVNPDHKPDFGLHKQCAVTNGKYICYAQSVKPPIWICPAGFVSRKYFIKRHFYCLMIRNDPLDDTNVVLHFAQLLSRSHAINFSFISLLLRSTDPWLQGYLGRPLIKTSLGHRDANSVITCAANSRPMSYWRTCGIKEYQ